MSALSGRQGLGRDKRCASSWIDRNFYVCITKSVEINWTYKQQNVTVDVSADDNRRARWSHCDGSLGEKL